MNLIELIGNTPLVELKDSGSKGVALFAKAEFVNPSGSVKDRAVSYMLADGIRRGTLTPGKTILDATSGNTGIAYAMQGAYLGYPVRLFMPSNTGEERKKILRNFGAELTFTFPLDGADGAYLAARELYEKEPDNYFYADQYNNPANPLAHYEGTGKEIFDQTDGTVTHFVAATGTSGTFTGTARRLKEEKPSVKTISVQPSSPIHGIEGAKHIASSLPMAIVDTGLWDGVIEVSTQEAYDTVKSLARREGLFVGVSSGANIAAARKLAGTVEAGSVIVTILCDSGARYLSESFWDE